MVNLEQPERFTELVLDFLRPAALAWRLALLVGIMLP